MDSSLRWNDNISVFILVKMRIWRNVRDIKTRGTKKNDRKRKNQNCVIGRDTG
jgi:hypothetical protein